MAERPPTYTREEMDAILKRALERQQEKAEEIGHEDLVAAAGEVGIPREEVEAAARDLEAEKAKKEAAAAPAATAPSPGPAGRDDDSNGRGRWSHAAPLLGMGMFLVLLAFQFGAGDWWRWPLAGMGVVLFSRATRILSGTVSPSLTARHEAHVSRRQRKRRRREEALADFERKVTIGADALLRVIDEAKRVKGHVDIAIAAHDRERRERQEPRARVLVTPPPVRVDTREPDAVERGDDARTSTSARRTK